MAPLSPFSGCIIDTMCIGTFKGIAVFEWMFARKIYASKTPIYSREDPTPNIYTSTPTPNLATISCQVLATLTPLLAR